MSESRKILLMLLAFLWCCPKGNTQNKEFVPEVDVYSKIAPDIRFNFQVKETREAGDPTQAEIGPGFDFFLKPLVRLKNLTNYDLDDAKARPLQFTTGFRYLPSSDKPHVERLELAVTTHLPLLFKVIPTDRSRADLDWSKGQFSWRYRNRLTFERRILIGHYHPAPYVSAEAFYQSQYEKWSTTALYAGVLLPAGKHFEFDSYYEHQNITGKAPNQQLNQLGLTLRISY